MIAQRALQGLRLAATTFAVAAVAWLPGAASAQSAASEYTSAIRYDEAGRAVGTIAPDPDGAAGPLHHAATRTTIDNRGLVTKVETGELTNWQSEDVLPENWTNFEVLSYVETFYDANRRKVREVARGENNVAISLTQFSYDNRGRLECTAVRMNSARWSVSLLPTSACTLGVEGNDGPDRITRTFYDAAGQVEQIRRAVGTDVENAEVTYTYTDNGQIKNVIDANGNKAEMRYDDYDRQTKWVFPSKTRPDPAVFDKTDAETVLATAGDPNENDFEQYEYDANGNKTKHRKRDGTELSFTYDALNRMTVKTVPSASRPNLPTAHSRNVHYTYDLRDLQTSIRFDSDSGEGALSAWDGFGRQTSATDTMDGANRTLTYQYDANGNRTRVTHPDNNYWQLEYDGLNRADRMLQGTVEIGRMSYNKRGTVMQREWPYSQFNTVTTPTYDHAGRTASLTHDLRASAGDVTFGYDYIPSGQLASISRSNEAYAWTSDSMNNSPPVGYERTYTTNGLNQYESTQSSVTKNYCYDANGNLTADGGSVYLYDVENRLVQKRAQGTGNTNCAALSYAGTINAELHYDPLGRLYLLEGYKNGSLDTTTRFLYDGDAMVAEYNAAGTMQARYVHGTNADADDPLIWYDGSTVIAGKRRFLVANHQGSIIAVANYTGALIRANSYDEYGINDAANMGRFQYTGQAWLEELDLYYYKARIYSPKLGRFLQTDPIGYEDQFNLYAYVGNDPVNHTDPTGTTVLCANNYCKEVGKEIANGLYEFFVGDTIAEVKQVLDNPTVQTAAAAACGLAKPCKLVKKAAKPVIKKLPKPPRGKGSVPKEKRAKPRSFTAKEREAKRAEQGGKCGNACGKDIDANNSEGHHIKRHSDGGTTTSDNHAEVCLKCHKEIHSPD